MRLRMSSPNAMPMNVAIAYPRTPTSIPGTTKEDHFSEAAIAAAVVGPPTFALLAIRASERRNFNNFAANNKNAKCVRTCVALKKNRDGAVESMSDILPEAPTVAKKAFMANAANASADCATSLHCFGNVVAMRTENIVAIGIVKDCEPLIRTDKDFET